MLINIVNKRLHIPTPHDFYIGRGCPLGNPYSHLTKSSAEFKTSSKQESIELYEFWLYEKIAKKDPEVLKYINKIYKHLKKHDQVNLVCFCTTKKCPTAPCHGDVIKKILEKIYERKG